MKRLENQAPKAPLDLTTLKTQTVNVCFQSQTLRAGYPGVRARAKHFQNLRNLDFFPGKTQVSNGNGRLSLFPLSLILPLLHISYIYSLFHIISRHIIIILCPGNNHISHQTAYCKSILCARTALSCCQISRLTLAFSIVTYFSPA